ncbi:MAG: hypothetical protein ACK2T7_00135 [Anaerolineales bacterium]
MDLKNSRLFQIGVRVIFFLTLLACPFIFIGMTFAPQMLGFLEPAICPDGMHLETRSEEAEDMEGEPITQWTTHCTGVGQSVDVTWKVMGIMFGIPALGVLIFVLAPTSKPKEEKPMIDPEAFK